MQDHCYHCSEYRECRYFEIVTFVIRRRLIHVPFCQRCAKEWAGKNWEDGKLCKSASENTTSGKGGDAK
jgi:hypothetical protein